MKKILLMLTLCSTLSIIACGEDGTSSSSSSSSYSNTIKHTCNGDVIFEKTYTSKETCENEKQEHLCNGRDMGHNC